MDRNNSLPVDNFRRFVPICGSTFTLIILLFIFQKELTWTKVIVFVLVVTFVSGYFYSLYKKLKVEKATLTERGIEIISNKNIYLIKFNSIKAISTVINYGFNLRLKYSNSYIIEFDEKYPFGSSISLVFPISESEPEVVLTLREKWLETKQNEKET